MLDILGLTPADQELYAQLAIRPAVTAEEADLLAAACGHPGTAAPALRRLARLGLVAADPDEPGRYRPLPPDEALAGALATRERRLAAARRRVARLAAAHRANDPGAEGDGDADAGSGGLVEICHGPEAALAWYVRLQRDARRQICFFDGPPYLSDYRENHLELDRLSQGVRYRVVYDRRAVSVPGRVADIEQSSAAGEESRVADVPMKLVVSDAPLAMLPLRTGEVGSWLIVHGGLLHQALAALFESYWERAVPLRLTAEGGAAAHGTPPRERPTPDERALLALLTAGHTESTIAGHLGLHEQTVHRRLRALMSRLDATSRFQAGYEAVRRGWLERTADREEARTDGG
ncbi:helix-turn-helix transcriptional regulator [Streptomyces sp. NPDC004031]